MRALSIACALWLAACAHALMGCGAHAPRVERTITSIGGVVISNAPAVNASEEPRAQGEHLVLDYGLLAENIGETPAVLDLVGARAALAQVGQEKPEAVFRVACLEAKRPGAPLAVLEPGERARIDCEIELTPALAAPLGSSERELLLAVPVHIGDEHALVYFDYQLHAGDAP